MNEPNASCQIAAETSSKASEGSFDHDNKAGGDNYGDKVEFDQSLGTVDAANPDSKTGRRIDAFSRLVRRVKKPNPLIGTGDYHR